MVRTRLLFLALAAVAAGVALAAVSLSTLLHTEANAGDPTMQLRASGTGVACDDANNPTSCTVPLSGPFTLAMAVTNFPADGYTAMQTQIDWAGSGLTYKPTAAGAAEIVWPDSEIPARAPLPQGCSGAACTGVQHGAISAGLGSTFDMFKGVVVQFAMNCSAGNSTQTVNLRPYDPVTNTGGSAMSDSSLQAVAVPADAVTIVCGTAPIESTATPTTGAEATATPTTDGGATSTPPPTATPGGATDTPVPPTNTPPITDPTATPIIIVPTNTPVSELGDVNKDGEIDSIDASLVLQHEAGLFDLSDQDNADVDRDGEISSVDALYILWIVADLFP